MRDTDTLSDRELQKELNALTLTAMQGLHSVLKSKESTDEVKIKVARFVIEAKLADDENRNRSNR